MTINGREVRFFRSVLANCLISDKTADGDVVRYLNENLGSANYAVSQRAAVTIMVALSNGYETAQKYKEPGYEPHPLTDEECLCLSNEEFNALFDEAMTAFRDDGKTTVQGEPVKTGKKTAKPKAEK